MLSSKDLHLNFLKLPNDLLSYIISGTFYAKKKNRHTNAFDSHYI